MTIAAVLLAAGRSRRFGTADKIAAVLDGLPLGLHAARMLAGAAVSQRIVVAGDAALDWPGFVVVRNDRPEAGLSRSIALGVAAARQSGAEAVLIALADMPFVPADHVARLIARYCGPATRVATGDGARRMPPVLFGADWFPALEALQGDRGARGLIDRADAVAAAAADLIDIDRPDELAAAAARCKIGGRGYL